MNFDNPQRQPKQSNDFFSQRLLLASLPSETTSAKCIRFIQDLVNHNMCHEIANNITTQQEQMNATEKDVLDKTKDDVSCSTSNNESLFHYLVRKKYLKKVDLNDNVESTLKVDRTKTKRSKTKSGNDIHESRKVLYTSNNQSISIFKSSKSRNSTLPSSKIQVMYDKLKNILLDEDCDENILLEEILSLLERHDKNVPTMKTNEISNDGFKTSTYPKEILTKDPSNSKNSGLDHIDERYTSHNQPESNCESKEAGGVTAEQEKVVCLNINSNTGTAGISNGSINNLKWKRQSNMVRKSPNIEHTSKNHADSSDKLICNKSGNKNRRLPNTVSKRKKPKKYIHSSTIKQEINNKTIDGGGKEKLRRSERLRNQVPKERRGKFDNYILGYFKDNVAGRKLAEEMLMNFKSNLK